MYKTILTFGIMLATVTTSNAMMIEGEQMSMDDAIMKAAQNGSMTKMYEIMQGEDSVMVELDMLYKMDTYSKMRVDMDALERSEKDGVQRTKRKAIRALTYRWPNARVPYEMSYEFSASDRTVISNAIADYNRYTCIRFVPATSRDTDRVRFQNGGGCSSYVGKIGRTQPISLARGCRYKGIVIHEMGHAIGFQHEQTRPDRDGYVSIQTQNIQSGVAYNFMKYPSTQVNNYGVPYDYTSVMHYSQNAFSANGRPTIIARDRRYQNAMGNRDGLSFNDIQLANAIYTCAANNRCAVRSCPQGFQGPNCKCWCNSGSRTNPIKECDGTTVTEAPQVTTVRPASTTAASMCENMNRYCPRWAAAGYCTGAYSAYMSRNCQLSCNTCSSTTTTTTTTAAPPTANCDNKNRYCDYWASRGECSRNPSYMNANCARACDTCEGGENKECKDMNSNCPSWTRYCNNNAYKDYLSKNCMRSCNICTASDELTTVKPATTTTPAPTEMCRDERSTSYCAARIGKCMRDRKVIYNCRKSCGLCTV